MTDPAHADALVTQDDREAAAFALDFGSIGMTWEKLTAAHRTPDQLWQANRVAQTIANSRTTAERRCYQAATERAARIAERTQSYDDRLQQSAGCSTVGQRIAKQIRGTDHVE